DIADEAAERKIAAFRASVLGPKKKLTPFPPGTTHKDMWEQQQAMAAGVSVGKPSIPTDLTFVAENGADISFVQEPAATDAESAASKLDKTWWEKSLEEREAAIMEAALERQIRLEEE